jgi:hypothetical protein
MLFCSSLFDPRTRDMKIGEYTRYEEMVQYCNKFKGVPVVTARRGDAKSIQELIHNIGKEEDIEGYVLRFDDGRYVRLILTSRPIILVKCASI